MCGAVKEGQFTWPRPFWQQPLWRWDAMFDAGVRAHYHASQLAAPTGPNSLDLVSFY